MPKNITGGSHHKHQKNRRDQGDQVDTRLEYANNKQVYAVVKKKPGGSRLVVQCSDDRERSAVIPGKFFKKVWMNVGDIVLCNLNPGSDDTECFIVYKYNKKEAKSLRDQGRIQFELQEESEDQAGQNDIDCFEDDSDTDTVNVIPARIIMPESESESDSDSVDSVDDL